MFICTTLRAKYRSHYDSLAVQNDLTAVVILRIAGYRYVADPYFARNDTTEFKRNKERLAFRHRASCILGQAFHCSTENAFYIFNQQIYFII